MVPEEDAHTIAFCEQHMIEEGEPIR